VSKIIVLLNIVLVLILTACTSNPILPEEDIINGYGEDTTTSFWKDHSPLSEYEVTELTEQVIDRNNRNLDDRLEIALLIGMSIVEENFPGRINERTRYHAETAIVMDGETPMFFIINVLFEAPQGGRADDSPRISNNANVRVWINSVTGEVSVEELR